MNPRLEADLKKFVSHLVANRWPLRLHATYDESITRFLAIFEEVNREIPFGDLHWMLDHAETIGDRNIESVKALSGGIAVQHRIAFQGEYLVERYGAAAAPSSSGRHTPRAGGYSVEGAGRRIPPAINGASETGGG